MAEQMGFNINLKKDYGMDFATLMDQCVAWQKAGYSDEEIQAELDRLAKDPEEQEGEADGEV